MNTSRKLTLNAISIMETKSRYCNICQELIIDSDGNDEKSYLHLVKVLFDIDICYECCEIGKHHCFEQIGFKRPEHKTSEDRKI